MLKYGYHNVFFLPETSRAWRFSEVVWTDSCRTHRKNRVPLPNNPAILLVIRSYEIPFYTVKCDQAATLRVSVFLGSTESDLQQWSVRHASWTNVAAFVPFARSEI